MRELVHRIAHGRRAAPRSGCSSRALLVHSVPHADGSSWLERVVTNMRAAWGQQAVALQPEEVAVESRAAVVHEDEAHRLGSQFLDESRDEVQGLAHPDLRIRAQPRKAQGVTRQQGMNGIHLETDRSTRPIPPRSSMLLRRIQFAVTAEAAHEARQADGSVAHEGAHLHARVRAPGGTAPQSSLHKLRLGISGHFQPLPNS
mmetsp:Transcript_42834/g.77398  ORF Transcript_42834/g.77398 Transcript_42834/m.77398 type:complete len:202 (+) Transcript_42834:114-719(+)